MFAQLYTPGNSQELTLLSEMLRNPDTFVNNVDMVEPVWLDWVRREHMTDGMLNRIIESPNGHFRLVDKIGWALKNWKLDQACSMAAIVSLAGFDSMASSSALTALRFCTQNMALANHRGDVLTAVSWAEKGERVFEKVLKADINACADFLNNRFIVRHNRYDFSPAFPEGLDTILRCLKDRYAAQCRGGCMVDRTLGELYGSICQNFGFCGPRHLSDCEAYAQMAVQAFGCGDVPELTEDALRQDCHLAYARLDAGERGKAQAAMFRYLKIEDWSELWDRVDEHDLSRWQHALLVRFLADAGDGSQRRDYLNWAVVNRSRTVEQDHPWQLWLYNLGRIAVELDRRQEAESLWEESLSLCLKAGIGPTVHVMALLPLSGLLRLGRLSSVNLAELKRRVSESVEILDPQYFAILRQKDFEDVLKQVWENPAQIFPFTYR